MEWWERVRMLFGVSNGIRDITRRSGMVRRIRSISGKSCFGDGEWFRCFHRECSRRFRNVRHSGGKGTWMCYVKLIWLHHVLGVIAEQNRGFIQILVWKVKRQFEKSNGSFAWWRESTKPTWRGVPLPPPAGQGDRLRKRCRNAAPEGSSTRSWDRKCTTTASTRICSR